MVRVGLDMGPEAVRRVGETPKATKVVEKEGRRGEEKEGRKGEEKEGKREAELKEEVNKNKRHATRSTPTTSGASTPAKRRANK